MATYSIAKGGNKRGYVWDNLFASANTAGDIKYDGALPRRTLSLPLHFDGQNENWSRYLREEIPNGLLVGQSIAMAFVNEGTLVHRVVINVKRAVPGLKGSFQFFDFAGVAMGARLFDVDFSVAGYVGLAAATAVNPDKNIPIERNGELRFTLTEGTFSMACFDVVTHLTTFKLDEQCSCVAAPPCVVITPTPLCFTP